jgi:hypothetical protein
VGQNRHLHEKQTVKPHHEPREQRVCSVCVTEPFLSRAIEKYGAHATCSYCEEEGNTFTVDQIADSVGVILADFYYRPYSDAGTVPPEGQPVQKLINELTETSDAALGEDIRCVLEERHASEWGESGAEDNPFDAGAYYARRDAANTWDFESDWLDFEKSLKTETRYFNKHAEHMLASLFEGLDNSRTVYRRSVIVEAGPGTALALLYRAREFQTERELREAMKRPHRDVGPRLPRKRSPDV